MKEVLRPIVAIGRRDLKRYIRERSQIFSTLTTSLLWLVLFGIGIGSMQFRRVNIDYQAFIFPGVLSMAILVTSIRAGISIIRDRESGYLRALLSTPVPPSAIIAGKLLSGVCINLAISIVIIIFGVIFNIDFSITGAVLSMPVIVLSSLVFLAMGIFIASAIESLEGFNLIMSLLIMPMFFTAGALFPIFVLPEWMKFLAKINPLSYCVDALRELMVGFPPPYFGIGTDVVVLLGSFVFFSAIGVKLFPRKF